MAPKRNKPHFFNGWLDLSRTPGLDRLTSHLFRNHIRAAVGPLEQGFGFGVVLDVLGLRIDRELLTAQAVAKVAVVDHETSQVALGDVGVW